MLSRVEGSYALGILCADTPDRIIAARKRCAAAAGLRPGENFLASDVTALLRHTRDVVYMDDGELAVITAEGIRIYDEAPPAIDKEHRHIDWDVDAAEKGGYDHFMLKEIYEQPAAVRRAITGRIRDGRVVLSDLTMTDREIRDIGRICIVACGSSYHVGMVGKYTLERLLRPGGGLPGVGFRYSDPLVGEGDLVIVISQSGETLDSMAALREAKKRGARVLSIVNVVGSSIARESDDVLYTGPDRRSPWPPQRHTAPRWRCCTCWDCISATCWAPWITRHTAPWCGGWRPCRGRWSRCSPIRRISARPPNGWRRRRDVFFIGRNLDYALSLEGSLKLKGDQLHPLGGLCLR